MSEIEKNIEPSFKLNYATAILLLVILIPVVYTIVANLQKPEPLPQITPAATVVTPPTNTASIIDGALQNANAKPGYDSYINLGLAYYNAKQYEPAIKAWKKALEYNPKGDLAYNNIAAAYGCVGNYDAEIEICNRALSINPNLDLARRNLAWATEMKNKK